MLVLFESPAGYGLFKCDEKVVKCSKEDIWGKYFQDGAKLSKFKLKAFSAFADTAEAVSCATAAVEGSVNKKLGKFLKKNVTSADTLLIADQKMSEGIKDKVSNLNIISNDVTLEVFRGIRENMESLMSDEVSAADLKSMALGLSHSLSRYKLKFSPDKVDTMIVQAIGLLDELDKEINTYAMRVKEWYGWHFPEVREKRREKS